MLQIAASAFEGLFIQALEVQGPIVERLRASGFDPVRMETTYTVDVWRKALQIASLEYYPTLSPSDAEFQLGVRMVDGYFKTIIGKLIQAGMPFFSPDSLCKKLPRFLASGVEGPQRMPEVTRLGEKHYSIQLWGDQGVPWFTAGSVDASLRKTKVVPSVRVAEVKADNFTIDITWV